MKQIIDFYKLFSREHFDIVHTHTTLAAAVIRLALIIHGKGDTKVINTTHGYFFWRGASFIKWLVFLPVELLCKCVTDSVVTMNKEDYYLANRFHLSLGSVHIIKGMGIDIKKFSPLTSEGKNISRVSFGYEEDAFILIYTAEHSKRKNHLELFKAINIIKGKFPNVILLCAGSGILSSKLENYIKMNNLNQNIKLLGYCANLDQIYPFCDVAVSSSISEGLPFNILESMACGLPVIASRVKGHTDLINHNENGLLYDLGNYKQLAECLLMIINNDDIKTRFKEQSLEIVQDFSIEKVINENMSVYDEFIK